MPLSRARFTVPLLVVLALATGPVLSGCSANPAEGLVEGIVQEAGGGDVDLNTDGGLPDGFPTNIALPKGEVTSGISVGDGEDQTWTVTIAIADVEGAFNEIKSGLEDAGFTSELNGMKDGAGFGDFDDGTHHIIISTVDDGKGTKQAVYIVSASVR